ncbi:hypothetical protein HaLaN_27413 [Haematococcus lacustris]|uniref:Uncharacterized protein n=1 Tax=Haematococcus lacustris TaxID=44745 RepID=A0A6A0A9W3_HAELA|nr:hypothetical protein HaLaN_27413 [Haematococcus lacustris]
MEVLGAQAAAAHDNPPSAAAVAVRAPDPDVDTAASAAIVQTVAACAVEAGPGPDALVTTAHPTTLLLVAPPTDDTVSAVVAAAVAAVVAASVSQAEMPAAAPPERHAAAAESEGGAAAADGLNAPAPAWSLTHGTPPAQAIDEAAVAARVALTASSSPPPAKPTGPIVSSPSSSSPVLLPSPFTAASCLVVVEWLGAGPYTILPTPSQCSSQAAAWPLDPGRPTSGASCHASATLPALSPNTSLDRPLDLPPQPSFTSGKSRPVSGGGGEGRVAGAGEDKRGEEEGRGGGGEGEGRVAGAGEDKRRGGGERERGGWLQHPCHTPEVASAPGVAGSCLDSASCTYPVALSQQPCA